MTALQFVTDFLIQKMRTIPTFNRNGILEIVSYENWPDFIVAIQLNKDDLIEWILFEFGHWFKTFDFKENIIDDGFESREGDFYVIELNGKLIKISYSEYDHHVSCYNKIEFDFVEQVEILVPKKIWQIKNY